MPGDEKKPAGLSGYAPLMNLGWTMATAIGGLTLLGWWLDGKWGTDPWLTLGGAALGMVVAFVELFRVGLPKKKKENR